MYRYASRCVVRLGTPTHANPSNTREKFVLPATSDPVAALHVGACPEFLQSMLVPWSGMTTLVFDARVNTAAGLFRLIACHCAAVHTPPGCVQPYAVMALARLTCWLAMSSDGSGNGI